MPDKPVKVSSCHNAPVEHLKYGSIICSKCRRKCELVDPPVILNTATANGQTAEEKAMEAIARLCGQGMRDCDYDCPKCEKLKLLLSSIPVGSLTLKQVLNELDKKECSYCHKPADGAMLSMGLFMAHESCVIQKLNELLDPEWETGKVPVETVAKRVELIEGGGENHENMG